MNRRSFLLTATATLPLATGAWAVTDATPMIEVMKSPSCGCCTGWVDHLRTSGFQTDVRNVSDDQLWQMKSRLGITDALASCHTAIIAGYVIEGHVPAQDISRLLAERPGARGLSVPGMPIGSPGMEISDDIEPFATLLIREDGTSEIFAHHS
ncbi:DUF411 domain-containing protein [Phaeobacter piscinae]|uniref:DUF411 domain-containing protein n=1 Tax=Phaeobacter piscinae TaxID=1580596 RepID=UPI000BBF095A|nr:DUF411 domain-containing protein [Phaeobacter piscinae]ATG40909.1 putative metal-binding protein [Phaeobacter piscinae]